MPSPYSGAAGSISAACISRLSEETINCASLSSSAVSALFDRVSFIAGSFMFPVSSGQATAIIALGFGRAAVSSSRAGKSAVDHDHLSGNEAVRLDERHHGFGHVLRGDTAPQRGELGAAAHELFVFVLQHPLHPVAFHPARRDGVHADVRTQVVGERLGQIDYRSLARRIRQRLRPRAKADDARRITMQPLEMRRSGTAARVTWNRPRTFTAKTRSQSSSEMLSRSLGFHAAVVPALLMSTSRRPNWSPTVFSIARTPTSSATSQRQSSMRTPLRPASSATALASFSLRL